MLKLIYAQRRRPGLSRKDYRDFLQDTRAARVGECRDALGLQGYTQLLLLPSPLNRLIRTFRSTLAPFDGIEAFLWPSSEALAQALEAPAGKRVAAGLIEEERRFVDLPASALWFVREHGILQGVSRAQGQRIKVLTWVGRGLPSLTVEAAQSRYLHSLAPRIRKDGNRLGIRDYVQMHTVGDPLADRFREDRGTGDPFALHARVVWNFSRMLSPFGAVGRNRALKDILDEERTFIDFKRSAIWMATEHVVFAPQG